MKSLGVKAPKPHMLNAQDFQALLQAQATDEMEELISSTSPMTLTIGIICGMNKEREGASK